MSKFGGPVLQAWQRKHLKLYPNRLEFYSKKSDGTIVKGKGVEVSVVLMKWCMKHKDDCYVESMTIILKFFLILSEKIPVERSIIQQLVFCGKEASFPPLCFGMFTKITITCSPSPSALQSESRIIHSTAKFYCTLTALFLL